MYGAATAWRRRHYATAPARQRRLTRPVVSVGNLRVGGSGKTPIAEYVARLLLNEGHRPAILTRGYARRIAADGVTVVSDGCNVMATLDRAGDEPLMLARSLPGVGVFVGADRNSAKAYDANERGALRNEPIQLIQPCSLNRSLSRSAIYLAVDLARPSTVALPLASP